MATNVLVPLLGEGVEEVTVTKWLKQEGDPVDELEPLLEVNTDKVDTEIPAPSSGVVLQIQVEEGVVAKVGQVLAVIGQAGEPIEDAAGPEAGKETKKKETKKEEKVQPPAAKAQPTPASAKGGTSQAARDLGFISPVVARIAAEHGLNLQDVPGTGLNGRITKKDVLEFIESGQPAAVDTRPAPRVSQVPPAITPGQAYQALGHSQTDR